MFSHRVSKLVFALALLTLAISVPSQAQINIHSGPMTTQANLSVGDSVSLVSVTGGPLTIPPDGTPSNAVTVSYSWNLSKGTYSGAGQQGLGLATWFNSTSALSTGGGLAIPSSAITETVGGDARACSGTLSSPPYAPQTAALTVSGAVCHNLSLFGASTIDSHLSGTGSQVYTLNYNTGTAPSPGNYSGTWNVLIFAD